MTNDPTSLCLDCSDHKLDCQCKDGARLPPAHTTTPWKCEKYEGDDADDNCKYIVMECKQSAIVAEIPVCCGWEEANAEHIVKCVNMHDELLELLTSITYLWNDDNFDRKVFSQIITDADEAIAKAKGE
jgi:hypothetical protein